MQKRSTFRLARERWDSLTRLNLTTHKTLASPTDASEAIAKWLRQLHAVWCSLRLIALLDKYNTYSTNQNKAKKERAQAEMAEISHSPTTVRKKSSLRSTLVLWISMRTGRTRSIVARSFSSTLAGSKAHQTLDGFALQQLRSSEMRVWSIQSVIMDAGLESRGKESIVMW